MFFSLSLCGLFTYILVCVFTVTGKWQLSVLCLFYLVGPTKNWWEIDEELLLFWTLKKTWIGLSNDDTLPPLSNFTVVMPECYISVNRSISAWLFYVYGYSRVWLRLVRIRCGYDTESQRFNYDDTRRCHIYRTVGFGNPMVLQRLLYTVSTDISCSPTVC